MSTETLNQRTKLDLLACEKCPLADKGSMCSTVGSAILYILNSNIDISKQFHQPGLPVGPYVLEMIREEGNDNAHQIATKECSKREKARYQASLSVGELIRRRNQPIAV